MSVSRICSGEGLFLNRVILGCEAEVHTNLTRSTSKDASACSSHKKYVPLLQKEIRKEIAIHIHKTKTKLNHASYSFALDNDPPPGGVG